ncbi:MAG: 50S ribosomal protein L25 [Vicinamibacterales bacterium]|nr:50S ribosomal protein L25 [Vicinamibacterales bacterium]
MDATLEAVVREGRGKNEANRLRAGGKIPAVVYGQPVGGAAPVATAVSVDPKVLSRILHSDSGANSLISLTLDGNEKVVMVREYQLDPVTHSLLHADFYALAMDRAITVIVPVQLVGEAPGVKLQGGIVDFVTRQISVECLPTQIPEHVTVDISAMTLNESVRVRDLPVDATWKPVSEPETMLVHIVLLKAEEAPATDTAVAAAAEPEVAKKGKTDKEGEDAKEKAKEKK